MNVLTAGQNILILVTNQDVIRNVTVSAKLYVNKRDAKKRNGVIRLRNKVLGNPSVKLLVYINNVIKIITNNTTDVNTKCFTL
jgi:hypothetical protein